MTEETPGPEELAGQLDELRALVGEQRDQLLRARAEVENQRKRGERAVEDVRKFALQAFIRDLLPVKDNLERGLEAVAQDAGDEAAALRDGIRMTLQLWSELLTSSGIVEIDPLGQSFDPNVHEALSIHSSSEATPNTVVEVAQKGYLLNGRLIRPARVIVAGGGEDADSNAD